MEIKNIRDLKQSHHERLGPLAAYAGGTSTQKVLVKRTWTIPRRLFLSVSHWRFLHYTVARVVRGVKGS